VRELGKLGLETVISGCQAFHVAAASCRTTRGSIGEHFARLRQLGLEALHALVRQPDGIELGNVRDRAV